MVLRRTAPHEIWQVDTLAKSYVDSVRITPKKVGKALELFESLILPTKNHLNIEGFSEVWSALLGVYSYAGDAGISRRAREFPWMTRLLDTMRGLRQLSEHTAVGFLTLRTDSGSLDC